MATLAEIGGLAVQFPPDFSRPNTAMLFQRRLAVAIAQACHAVLGGPPSNTPRTQWCGRALLRLDEYSRSLLYLFIIERADSVPANEVFNVSDTVLTDFVTDFLARPGLNNYNT